VLAGIRLAPYGETLGRHLHIGQGWIGLIFLATLTSIPEMTTTITGASIGAPNIALGNALGSNLFNVAIVAFMDILLLAQRRGIALLGKVQRYHVISGFVAIGMTGLAIIGVVVQPKASWLGISPISVLIFVVYVIGVILLLHAENVAESSDDTEQSDLPLWKAAVGFLVCGAVIVVSGIFLIRSSKVIADTSGLSSSLMGAVLVAIVTSLPELAASIGALRIRAYDMIIGNLFGSNMFNILTIFFADVAFRGGAIYSGLGTGATDQLIVAVGGVLLTLTAIVAILVRLRRRASGPGIDSLLLLAGYLGLAAVIIGRGIQL